MPKRQKFSSGTKWEAIAGYSRAIRTGNWVHVAGTTATDDDGAIVGINDPYAQTMFIIRKMEKALKALGATLDDVVRTRVYLVDVTQWEAAARAHGEIFADIRPVNTMLEISALIGEGYLVEMEMDAFIGDTE